MEYIILTITLFIIINIYFKLADSYNIIDKPNERSSHTTITIRGGGIIFLMGILSYFFVSGFKFPLFFIGLFLIALISFLDDIITLSNKLRLLFHFSAIFLLLFELGIYQQNFFLIIPLLIISVGIINVYNFMDGINGITGLYSLSVLTGLYFINNFSVEFIDNELFYFLGLAILVFNFYNFRRKAICFAGDIGSISLAFILLFLIFKLSLIKFNISIILLLGVYGIDSILTIIHRIYLKENIFKAHRKHCYQILANEAKVPHLVVSTIYFILQLILSSIVYYLYRNNTGLTTSLIITLSILLFLSIVYIIVKRKYFHLHNL